jgi:hypothetical protein
LAQHHDGFESPWLFRTLKHILWQEPGYDIFVMKPHLFTITKDPYPIYCSVVHVAVANHFLANNNVIPYISELSLGQRMQAGMSYLIVRVPATSHLVPFIYLYLLSSFYPFTAITSGCTLLFKQ